MIRAIKYRLYPTEKQKVLLEKHFNACRFVYNLSLQTRETAYSSFKIRLHKYTMSAQLTDLKKECPWLNEVDRACMEYEFEKQDLAYNMFFRGAGFPRYKRKKNSASFTNLHGNLIKLNENKVSIPKFREGIKFSNSYLITSKIRSYTILKTVTGKYFITISHDKEKANNATPKQVNITGFDLGISSFIIDSSGNKIDAPKHFRKDMSKLKVLQREASRKLKGSNNSKSAYLKVAIHHEKVLNKRTDFLHKLSDKLTNDSQVLCFEDLNVKGMIKNRKLALSISDASWSKFTDMCQDKAEMKGGVLIKIPRFEPSSKRCSACNELNTLLKLSDREWTCEICGTIHDRDINAAINIKNYVLNNYCGGMHREKSVELSTIVEAVKQKGKSKPHQTKKQLP